MLDGVVGSIAAGMVRVMNPTGVVVAVVWAWSVGTSEASSVQRMAVARGRIRREDEVFIGGYVVWIWTVCKGNSIKICSDFVKFVKRGAWVEGSWMSTWRAGVLAGGAGRREEMPDLGGFVEGKWRDGWGERMRDEG